MDNVHEMRLWPIAALAIFVDCTTEVIQQPALPADAGAAVPEESAAADAGGQVQPQQDAGCTLGRLYVDKDRDGFGAGPQVEVCIPAGPGYSSTPGDCNDDDPRAFPGQTMPQEGTVADGGTGDFNCNGEQTQSWTTYGQCNAAGGRCVATGFATDFWLDVPPPACGKSATFVTQCTFISSATKCQAITEQRKQKCL